LVPIKVSNFETISPCKQTICQDNSVISHTEARNVIVRMLDMGKHKHGPICSKLLGKTRSLTSHCRKAELNHCTCKALTACHVLHVLHIYFIYPF